MTIIIIILVYWPLEQRELCPRMQYSHNLILFCCIVIIIDFLNTSCHSRYQDESSDTSLTITKPIKHYEHTYIHMRLKVITDFKWTKKIVYGNWNPTSSELFDQLILFSQNIINLIEFYRLLNQSRGQTLLRNKNKTYLDSSLGFSELHLSVCITNLKTKAENGMRFDPMLEIKNLL